MAKEVNIEYVDVKAVSRIEVDGKNYPIHGRNLDVVREYRDTGDESVLDKLVDFSLDLG